MRFIFMYLQLYSKYVGINCCLHMHNQCPTACNGELDTFEDKAVKK